MLYLQMNMQWNYVGSRNFFAIINDHVKIRKDSEGSGSQLPILYHYVNMNRNVKVTADLHR